VIKLQRKLVEKPWGRTELPAMFGWTGGRRIGEVWFTGGGDLPLLAKYIFTSERLSIQVHPNDQQARERGLRQGKSECWAILDAEPGATIGLGLKREVGKDELRAAALDGSIEELIDWRPVSPGDFVFVPSGTVHAIGAGISLLEFQQNADVTYRLYDYGRPRELHLDDGISVSNTGPFSGRIEHVAKAGKVLVDGPHFTLIQSSGDALEARLRWVMPLQGNASGAGPGECLLVEPGERIEASVDADLLIGATSQS
jgi:mannose-6-phosphate isomerase